MFPLNAASHAWLKPVFNIFSGNEFVECFAHVVSCWCVIRVHCVVDAAVVGEFVVFVKYERVGCADGAVRACDVLCFV